LEGADDVLSHRPTFGLVTSLRGAQVGDFEVATGGGFWVATGAKEKLLSLGVYPDVSLKDARQRRDELRQQLASGR